MYIKKYISSYPSLTKSSANAILILSPSMSNFHKNVRIIYAPQISVIRYIHIKTIAM